MSTRQIQCLMHLLLLCCLLTCHLSAAPALAQAAKRIPPVEITQIDMGWGGTISAGRWSPMTVWVTSAEQAFSGELSLEYSQDATQSTVVVVPVSTTPGRIIPVELEAALPGRCERLSFVITGPSGREEARWQFSRMPSQDEHQLPAISQNNGLVLTIGDTNAHLVSEVGEIKDLNVGAGPAAARPPTAPAIPTTPPSQSLWNQLDVATVAPARMPLSWAAYESADAVVTTSEALAQADPRARAALIDWVQSGGRLVLLIDPAGSAWRTLFPPQADFVTAEDQRNVVAGPALHSLVLGKDAAPAPISAKARPMRLTPIGGVLGWKLGWEVVSDSAPAAGLKASGPLGLGMLTLISIDPHLLSPTVSDIATRRIWRDALEQTLAPHAQNLRQSNGTYYGFEQEDPETSGAINQTLDHLATVPPLGMGVFIAISACMLLLAIMIGPVDAVVLKRLHLSQRSWLTALCWIGLACIVAYLAPMALRSGATTLTRCVVGDVICDADGLPTNSAQTGITAIFGGRPLSTKLDGTPAGSWFRGVSSLYSYGDSTKLFSPLTLPIVTQEDGIRGTPATPFTVPQWTFRAVMDLSPLRPGKASQIGARAREKDGAWDVTILNVPKSAVISAAFLRTRQKWCPITFNQNGTAASDDRLGNAITPKENIISIPHEWSQAKSEPNQDVRPFALSAPTLSLPGARERAAAIEAMLVSDHWACICLRIDNLPPDLTPSPINNLKASRTAVLRILVPVEK